MSTAQKCERCREYNAAAVDFRNQAANAQSGLVALLARHNALVEAVAWERECSKFFSVVFAWYCPSELPEILKAARAEVDRLIAERAAGCKGEG